MSVEESFTVTLKLTHTDGCISSARLLKGRSKLPEEVLTRINQLFSDTFEASKSVTQTTVALGNFGEQTVLAYLRTISKYNADFEVSDTSSSKDHGDLSVEYKDKRICIEVKNYTKAIPGKEIDKYHRSLALPDYHMGIMISLNEHGFAKEYKLRSPIDIRTMEGKPTAYLSGVDVELIYPVITVLMSMNSSSQEISDVHRQLDIKVKALIAIHERAKDMRTILEAQKKSIAKLEVALNEIHALALL